VLVGHSAGGPLALLAALRPQEFRGDCTAPPVTPDAVVGLAGAYDLDALGDVALALLGAPKAQAPDLWQRADVYAAAAQRPDVPVLLVHGTGDDIVPPSWSTRLRDSLVAAHHEVRLEQPKGVDHLGVYDPNVSGPLILDWLRGLGGSS
jgi:pimeloyl-ACP methyl ester carboxylesterase